ncbi:MAG: cache domain-containing protein [Burkholderiales bacterium]|nr:cache domain-containing protein [Burkholderiales bacterium]
MTISTLFSANLALAAGDRGNAEEAKALVKKGIAYLKSNSPEQAYAAFNDPKGQFVDRDLYLFVFDKNGKALSHGANAKLIGKDMMELKDADGKYFIKAFYEVANKKGSGWVDYKWPHPVTKAIEQKSSYIEKLDNGDLIGCGIYK